MTDMSPLSAPFLRNYKLNETLIDLFAEKFYLIMLVIYSTKVMIISRGEMKINIHFKGKVLERVLILRYLGSLISCKGKIETETSSRTAPAGKLFRTLDRKFISALEILVRTKMLECTYNYTTILTYGSEWWAMTHKEVTTLQTVEMRYLRRLEGKTRRNRIFTKLL